MPTKSKSVKVNTAALVRAYAVEAGILPAGQRGRLGREAYALWNSTHKSKALPVYLQGEAPKPKSVKVTVKPLGGRTVTRTVVLSEARSAAQAHGLPVGKVGRLSKSVLQAAALGFPTVSE